ncbi:MAG: WG repeat-containing protein [Pseudomonadota bacterium]
MRFFLSALSCALCWCAAAGAQPAFSVRPEAIEALQLTVTRQDSAGAAETEQVYFLRRAADALVLPSEPGAVLAGLAAGAQPAFGVRRCDADPAGAAQTPLYLAAELRIWITDQPPLRLRSDSRCAFMLPWQVTDGGRLAALDQRAAGLALMRLIQGWCGSCLPEWRQAPPEAPAAAPHGEFEAHYEALLAAWRQLGRRRGATDIKLATLPLTDALDWMDHDRFERTLRATAKGGKGRRAVLAADLLRTLQVARWGYVDRQGRLKLPRRFERATPFAAGQAMVRVDGGWQQIDRLGQRVAAPPSGGPLAPPSASSTSAVSPGAAASITCDGGQRVNAVRPYADGLAAARCGVLWGYLDRDGRFVIPPRYMEAGDFADGLAPVR